MLHLLARRGTKAQPRVTPDDAQAAALRRKRAALDYVPANGFHKDRKQDRMGRPLTATRGHKLA